MTAPGASLRLLVVDHTAVLRNNRVRWSRIAQRTGATMTLLAPKMWIENNVREPYQRDSTDPFDAVQGRVLFPGNAIRSFYITGLLRAFRRSRPHAIVMMEESFTLFALQVVLLARFLAPRAPITFYNVHISGYDFGMYRLGWLYRRIARWVMRRTQTGFCHDERAASFLRESTFTGQVRTLFWGINEDLFQPRDRDSVRREFNVDPSSTLILFAGRLPENKGVQDLIAAFDRLRRARADLNLRLMIVGTGEYRSELERQAAASGSAGAIEFREPIPIERMPELMSCADIFVLPSRPDCLEQFGRVLVEAMLVETTVVGSTSGAIPGIVEGRGYVFEAGSVESLRDALAEVLDDPAEADRRRRAARSWAMGRYSIDNFVEGTIDALEDLCGRPLRTTVAEEVGGER